VIFPCFQHPLGTYGPVLRKIPMSTSNRAENETEEIVSKEAVLILITAASIMNPFLISAVNVALPSIGEHFHMHAVALSWVNSALLLASSVFLVPFGRIADIYGRKLIFLVGTIIYTVSSILCMSAGSGILFILYRGLQGIGNAMVFATSLAIITSVFPPEERGRALGINLAGIYVGLALGPFIGGLLTQHFGWQSIFFVQILIGTSVTALIVFKLRAEWRSANGERFDLTGSLIYAAALIMIFYGFSVLSSCIGIILTSLGIMAFIGFITWEGRIKQPVLEIGLFRNNQLFAFSNLASLLYYTATFAIPFLLSLYLQYVKSLTPEIAGIVLVSEPVMMALLSPFAGRLSDYVQPRVISSVGMSLSTIGIVMLIFISGRTGIGYVITSLIFVGVGFGLFTPSNTNAIMGSVSKKYSGVASGTTGTMRLLGQMSGMGVTLLVFALVIGNIRITVEHYDAFMKSVRLLFIVFSILCFCGIFVSLFRGKMTDRTSRSE